MQQLVHKLLTMLNMSIMDPKWPQKAKNGLKWPKMVKISNFLPSFSFGWKCTTTVPKHICMACGPPFGPFWPRLPCILGLTRPIGGPKWNPKGPKRGQKWPKIAHNRPKWSKSRFFFQFSVCFYTIFKKKVFSTYF